MESLVPAFDCKWLVIITRQNNKLYLARKERRTPHLLRGGEAMGEWKGERGGLVERKERGGVVGKGREGGEDREQGEEL